MFCAYPIPSPTRADLIVNLPLSKTVSPTKSPPRKLINKISFLITVSYCVCSEVGRAIHVQCMSEFDNPQESPLPLPQIARKLGGHARFEDDVWFSSGGSVADFWL